MRSILSIIRSAILRRAPRADGGAPPVEVTVSGSLRADYRVADTTIEGYELYIGQDAEPDLTAAPDETFASLPHDSSALTAGHEYRLVTRYRNRYGLVSQNMTSWRVTSDGTGAAEATTPSHPLGISVDAAAAGAVRIQADYLPSVDASPATIWAIWITDTGTDPDPDVDAATATETMTTEAGIAHLDYTSGGYADAATIKVVVRTRRVDSGPTSVDSTNTTVYSATADTDGPAAPSSGIFHGEQAKEGQ